MKKYILSVLAISFVLGCNEPKIPPGTNLPPAMDSIPAKLDSAKVVQADKTMGSGLTLEEMSDDSVFSNGSVPTSWEISGITDVKEFKLFLKQLQVLVLNNNKEQLAKLVRYPLNKSIKNEKDFIKNYDRIFTKDAKLSIAKINFSQIFRNYQGAMSEDGKVWFSQEGKEFKIISVNN